MIPVLAAAAISAVLAAGGAWQYQANKYERVLSEQRTEYATAQVRALEMANADTIRLQAQAQTAAAAAAARLRGIAADRERLRVTADGLSNAATDAASRACSDTTAARSEPAAALADVFGQCVGELKEVAEHADRWASEAVMLLDAWPR